ncbi:putative protein RST1 [Iris pallida]|uniref:Uncharacterized protein n=1 Tax=Iris pallida TaxID=29817 RepID=A0AAX6DLC6_IRIPA|nr:putative protein RST1 [Iris pallida]
MKWLFQDEHEHQQWPAVISLGLISNCFHATDRKNKVEVIGGLLKGSKNLVLVNYLVQLYYPSFSLLKIPCGHQRIASCIEEYFCCISCAAIMGGIHTPVDEGSCHAYAC